MAKLTSFMISPVLIFLENEILNNTGLSRTEFHRRMIQYFFDNDVTLSDGVFKMPPKDETVIKEQIYLESEDENRINIFMLDYNRSHGKKCTATNILTQAMASYGVHIGLKIMEEEKDERRTVGIATGILYILEEKLVSEK